VSALSGGGFSGRGTSHGLLWLFAKRGELLPVVVAGLVREHLFEIPQLASQITRFPGEEKDAHRQADAYEQMSA